MRIVVLVVLLALVVLPGVARPQATDTLTVVTLNLWHDQRDWPKRLAVMLAGIRELRPDVLCLQEVLQHATLRNQAETLADSLGYQVHFTSVDSLHHVKRYGNAILTRHPVLRTGGKNLAPLNDYRTVAHVRIDYRGRDVDVYDTHLHHTPQGGSIRARQIRDLLAFIDSTRADGAVVLAGDFNAELGTREMRLLATGFELPVTGFDAGVSALVVKLVPQGPNILTGAAQGPEASLICLMFLVGAIAMLLWRLRSTAT